jgi:predicted nuclease of predicted toxin-antitoxin system
MLKLAVDEDFDNDLVRGLLRRKPELEILRVQDVGLSGASDPTVLNWAAQENRILLTHDVNSMTKHAYERVVAGQPMSGVFVVRQAAPFGVVIEDILLLIEASSDQEWQGQVRYLPL